MSKLFVFPGREEIDGTADPGRSQTTFRTPLARACPEAELDGALEARETTARHHRRAAAADRDGLRGHPRGGHRPAQVVGPVPRQAEGRNVHAPDQAPAGRVTPAQLRAIGELSNTHGRGEAELSRGRRSSFTTSQLDAAGGLRPAGRGGHHDRRRAVATPSGTSPAAPSPASRTRALRRARP